MRSAISYAVEASTSSVLSVDCVENTDTEKIFLRVDPKLKKAWIAVTEGVKITQADAGRALVEWAVSQDIKVRQVLFGQRPDLNIVAAVVDRIDNAAHDRRGAPGSMVNGSGEVSDVRGSTKIRKPSRP